MKSNEMDKTIIKTEQLSDDEWTDRFLKIEEEIDREPGCKLQ